MDDTLLFIPPCCVDKKLPRAVMQAPHRALTFYTHGDVTMEQLYRAVSYLLDDRHVMVLTMPVVTSETAYFLSQCFERKWISHLILSSRTDSEQLIGRYLPEYRSRILFARGGNVTELSSHLVLYTPERAVVINGPMYEQPQRLSLVSYSMVYYPILSLSTSEQDWGNSLRNVLFPDVLRHRNALGSAVKDLPPGVFDRFVHLEFPPMGEE